MTTPPPPHVKRYVRDFVGFMAAYVAVLIATLIGLRALGDDSPWRYLVAPLPVLPAIGLMVALVRYLRDIDELQRRIQLEAIGMAFGATALITFCYGFLQNVGFPPLDAIWIGPAMVVLWGMTSALATRRYQ